MMTEYETLYDEFVSKDTIEEPIEIDYLVEEKCQTPSTKGNSYMQNGFDDEIETQVRPKRVLAEKKPDILAP